MKIKSLCLIAIAFLVSACADTADKPAPLSFDVSLNDGWEFQRTDEVLGTTPAESVTLPHTPRLEPTVVNDQWQGDAWYRKTLYVPESWADKTLIIRFEGAMNAASLSVNGSEVSSHLGGYLPFVTDITKHVQVGADNLIEVVLNNEDNPIAGPKPLVQLDFNMYGGLYRGAILKVRDAVHISDEILEDKIAGGGIFVSYPDVGPDTATVRVGTHVKNTGAVPRSIQVQQQLFYAGKAVAEAASETVELEGGSDLTDTQYIRVQAPHLWSPKNPHLYTLVTQVLEGDRVVDEVTQDIGIRHFEIKADGFFINGEKMFLRGVNRHQEYPYVGYALSANADYRDAVKIKEAGFDYVRLSHYPHSKAFMKAADKLGLVLLDAVLGWQYFNEDPAFAEQIKQTCRDLIRRDRNHPSVIAWECSLNETQKPDSFIKELHEIVHEEFPYSPAYSAGWVPEHYDIYLQARQHRLQHYSEPSKPYVVSEYGDWEYYAQNAGFNQDTWANLKEEERTSRQLLEHGEKRLLQQALNIQEAHNDNFNTPAFADGYWVMFDYNRGYADDLEASGIMSIHRLPKYSYYFYQSQRDASEQSDLYKSGPMVFIASNWTEDSPSRVTVFSNADMVELTLNGRMVGRKEPTIDTLSSNLNHPPFHFNVAAFEPGELVATAYIAGEPVAKHQVKTPMAPARFELVLDEGGKPASLGERDRVFVHARLVDEHGTVVPQSGLQVNFTVAGKAKVLNPDAIVTRAGVASALLQIEADASSVSVTVSSDGKPSYTGTLQIDLLQ